MKSQKADYVKFLHHTVVVVVVTLQHGSPPWGNAFCGEIAACLSFSLWPLIMLHTHSYISQCTDVVTLTLSASCTVCLIHFNSFVDVSSVCLQQMQPNYYVTLPSTTRHRVHSSGSGNS